MYNQEIKEKYIKEEAKSHRGKTRSTIFFNAIEPYETKWNSDLCSMKVEQLSEVLQKTSGMSVTTRSSNYTRAKRYIEWCIANNVPGACGAILDVKRDDISQVENIRRRTVKNPFELNVFLNQLFDPDTEDTIDLTYRCYFWCAYAGIKQEDVMSIRTRNVDLIDGVIRYKGEEFPIYQEARTVFKKCVKLNQFINKKYKSEIVYKDRVDGNLLLRGLRAAPTVSYFGGLISKIVKAANDNGKVNKTLAYTDAYISGFYYRMYLRESAGLPIPFEQLTKAIYGDIKPKDIGRYATAVKKNYYSWKETL